MTATMDAELVALMNLSVSVEHRTGFNVQGAETYGTAETKACYADRTHRMVRSFQGQERVATLTLYLASDDLLESDQFTFEGRPYETLAVSTYYDENGAVYGQVVSLT